MIEKINDINLVLSFIRKFFPQYSGSDNPFEKVICYKVDDKVVGFMSYSIIYEKAEMNYIAVDLDYRRKGIAQKMFDYALSDLKNNMVENFSLEVRADNRGAINFYLKNGFEIVTVRKKYYGECDGYLMVLEVV